MIEAKRPMDYDPKLRPKTEIHPYSFGFPSIESTMAVVVFLSISGHYQNWLVTLVCIALIALVGLSRVYSRSRCAQIAGSAYVVDNTQITKPRTTMLNLLNRFIHQVLGSYVVGFVGLKVAQHYCAVVHASMSPRRWTPGHLCCTLILAALLLGYIAIRIENNDTKWAGKQISGHALPTLKHRRQFVRSGWDILLFFFFPALKHTEYTRVIGDIVQQSSRGGEGGDAPVSKFTPRSQHRMHARRRPPRDSFFYLQRNLLQHSTPRYDGSSYEESWALDSAREQHFSDRERNAPK